MIELTQENQKSVNSELKINEASEIKLQLQIEGKAWQKKDQIKDKDQINGYFALVNMPSES